MDLSHNKHAPALRCLETMSNHLMTAHAKQPAECIACFQFCSCLGLYSNKHHQFYSTHVLLFPSELKRHINTSKRFLSKSNLYIHINFPSLLNQILHCICSNYALICQRLMRDAKTRYRILHVPMICSFFP